MRWVGACLIKNRNMKDLIKDTIDDLVSCFLYYDRKEDEDLPVGEIEKAISEGIITIDEMVQVFSETLKERIEN